MSGFGGAEAVVGKVHFTPNEPRVILNEGLAVSNDELCVRKLGPGGFGQTLLTGTPVAGQEFEYAFDDIGYRKTAGRGENHECIPNSGTDGAI